MNDTGTVRKTDNPATAGAELLQLRVDRRLGHEWDDWDGEPLPDGGVFTTRPGVFFALLAGTLVGAGLAAGLGVWLLAPRLAAVWGPLPAVLGYGTAAAFGVSVIWLGLIGLSYGLRRPLLPERLAERGPLAGAMPAIERVGAAVGIGRDRVGNAALRVFNALAAARRRDGVDPEDILVLLPRCLSKDAMQGAMTVAGRYGVPLFVAARGMYARRMIGMRRPRRIVAIACERDLVSGIHDVASSLPVMGSTLALPDGPCKNTEVSLDEMESRIRTFLGLEPRDASE